MTVQDDVLSSIWEGKEVIPFDEDYSVLDRVAEGKMVAILDT